MNLSKLFRLLAVAGISSTLSLAGTVGFSFTGVFLQDNSVQLLNLDVATTSVVTIGTLSYGGGSNYDGAVIGAGGFAPELTLFDPTGNEFAFDAGASVPSCNGRAVDPVSGFCLDAVIYDGTSQPVLTLTSGTWIVALTQQGNDPLGSLSEGFSEDAANGNDPTFTGTNAGIPGATFLDPFDGAQRTNEWALDVVGTGVSEVSEVSSAPEPQSELLAAMGLLWIGLRGIRAKCGPTRETKKRLNRTYTVLDLV